MTREDIIRMAREAGLFVPHAGIPENGALTRFAALVASAEREACAQIVEKNAAVCTGGLGLVLDANAMAIRARSKT